MKEPSAERKYMGLQSTVLAKAATCVAVAAPVYVTHIKIQIHPNGFKEEPPGKGAGGERMPDDAR